MPRPAIGENADALHADLSARRLFDVAGKVVVMSGGGSGIGAMLASGFVQGGSHVFIFSRKPLDEFAGALTALGPGTCTALRADVQDGESLDAAAARVGELKGHVDILVNNAGTNYNEAIETSRSDMFQKVVDVNLVGAYRVVRAFLPLLRASASPPARLINVASVNGLQPPTMMDTFSYSSSKAGLLMLTRHLAARLAPDILVNALCPGPFRSRMMRGTLDGAGEAATIASTALGRLGQPADCFGAALLLASPAGAWITGAAFVVDGGQLLCRL